MAQVIADRRDVDFVLHEQFRLGDLSEHDLYADFNKKVIDMIITEARNLAIKEILPTRKTGDEQGVTFEKGKVTMPDGFKEAWQLLIEGEWFSPSQPPEWGGQGIPETLGAMTSSYLIGANMALMMIGVLNNGAGKILEQYGTDEQKETYLRKLYSGEWGGTMMLTEAEAGSNLGDLLTSATKNDDGTYSIVGNKIFISGGDHDMTDNIIHMVLARVEGAPAGSKGTSLFLVPQFFVNADGSLGEENDVVVTGIEEKMGLHGSPTCSVALGGKNNCIGYLIGEENKGLAIMFTMMNHARLLTGAQGLAVGSFAYLDALQYARERIQGVPPGAKDKAQQPIINHPDVKRMLLTMKSYIEGLRSLICYIAYLEDLGRVATDKEEKQRCHDLIDLLIPIGKAYTTDRGIQVCDMAIQIYGGYGYTSEFPVEQAFRDLRIASIYEGTNGIQAQDFLGRKVPMKGGAVLADFAGKIRETITEAKEIESLAGLADKVDETLSRFLEVAEKMNSSMRSPEMLNVFAGASLFLEVAGDLIMAWMLLWRASIADGLLKNKPKKKDIDFYDGQLKSAQFFIETMLPVTMGKLESVNSLSSAVTDMSDAAFAGK